MGSLEAHLEGGYRSESFFLIKSKLVGQGPNDQIWTNGPNHILWYISVEMVPSMIVEGLLEAYYITDYNLVNKLKK